MELTEAVRRRHMVRSFDARPVEENLLEALLVASLCAPTAGNTKGTAWLVLRGAQETSRYWEHTTDEEWRGRSRRWPGLSRAPVVALSLASPGAYFARYAEPDKAAARAAGDPTTWPVPYWFGDAAFATMSLLLGAADAGLGACLLGNFLGEAALLEELSVPQDWRLFAAVLLGHPDGGDHRSASLDRPGPAAGERVHRGRWGGPAEEGGPRI